ncbi:MAG TPA: hypothetical protein VF705_09625, partial [Longimicrobium sp.]
PGRVWEAFTRFANGDLRVVGAGKEAWNGEPNSAQLFCFAEFAFMAIEQGVDTDAWRLILPSQVAMQPIFMRVYQPPGQAKLRFEAYVPENFARERQLGPAEMSDLRQRVSAMSPDELKVAAGVNAREAFRDQ